MNDRLCNSHRSFALQSALSWPTSAHLEQIYKGGRLFRRRRLRNKSPGAHLRNRFDLPQYCYTPPPTMEPNKGEQPRRSSDMRQARHLPQRWYWDIVAQNPYWKNRRTNHQPIDRSGLAPASVLGEASETKRHATGTPDLISPPRTRIGNRRTNHQPIDRSGLLLPPVYGEHKGTQQEPQTPLSPVRVAAHGKHA
ncbi:hypothetical protein TNCV_4870481, partial [Trichonephila clavipes]